MKQTLASFLLTPTPSWGASPKARLYANEQYRASTGELHPAGEENYQEITLTLEGAGFRFPSTQYDTTDDSSNPNATCTLKIYNGSKEVYVVFERWMLRASLGATVTIADLETANVVKVPLRDDSAYSKVQVDLRIASQVSVGNPATASAIGRVRTSATPSDPANPVAVITDDPQYINARDATKIQSRPVASTRPASGQALVYNTSADQWEPGTPSEGPSLPIVLRDEFTSPDGSTNTGRRPSYVNRPNTAWQNGAGTWTIQDNRLQPSSPFADGDYQILDAGVSDLTLTCRVSSDAGSDPATSASADLIIRYEDEDNYLTVVVDARAGLVVLYDKTNGVFSSPLVTIAAAPASNSQIPVTVTAVGPQLGIYLFGQNPVLYTTSSHLTATKVGVRAGSGGGVPAGVPTFAEFTVLPALVKSATNPIIPRGGVGEWDSVDVAAPSAPVLDAANDRYAVAYSGFDGVLWHTGIAYCPVGADLTDAGNWTKEPTNPKLSPVPGEGYIAASAGLCFDGTTFYQVYQIAPNASAGVPTIPWRICAASSPDLTDGGTWTRMNSGQPILPLGAVGTFDQTGQHDADVRFRTDGQFEIFFAGRSGAALFNMGHSVGPSLLSMGATVQLPVAPGTTGLGNVGVVGNDPYVYSIYFAYAVGTTRHILRADTDDGGETWKFLNGVLFKGTGWEGVQTFDPAGFTLDGRTYVLYSAANAPGGTEGMGADIGIAVFDAPTDAVPTEAAPDFTTLTDGATVTLDFTNNSIVNARVTLGGNRTLAVTGATSGDEFNLYVTQDAVGSRTLTLPAGWKVAGGGGGAVALTATANAVDLIRGRLVGSVWRVEKVLNFT